MAYQFGQFYSKNFPPFQFQNFNSYNGFQNMNPNGMFSNIHSNFRAAALSPQNFNHNPVNNSPNSIEQNMILIKPRIREQIRTPKCKSVEGKKFLVLDLDETVVLSSTSPSENYDLYKCFLLNGTPSNSFIKFRPGANEFIEKLAKYYHIIIFTASYKEYAEVVQQNIDPFNYIEDMYWRDHCIFQGRNIFKNLSILGTDLKNVILVDNNPVTFSLQPENGLPILSWAGNEDDNELSKLIEVLIFLADVEDVRQYIPHLVDQERKVILYEKLDSIIKEYKRPKIIKNSYDNLNQDEIAFKNFYLKYSGSQENLATKNDNNINDKQFNKVEDKKELKVNEISNHEKQLNESIDQLKKNDEEHKKKLKEIESIANSLEIPEEMGEKEILNLSISDNYKIFKVKETSFTKYRISPSNNQNKSKFIYDSKNNCFVIKAPSKIGKKVSKRANDIILKDQTDLKIRNKVDPFILVIRKN